MKKRIVIIEPQGVSGNVFAQFMALPMMGPLYLGTILKNAGHSVSVLNENILGRNVSMSELDADVCCVSALTPTVERGYEILRQYKAIRPGGLSLIGGVHPTFMTGEASVFADHVVAGEGEQVIADLVSCGADEKVITGTRVSDLDSVPVPDLSILSLAGRLPVVPLMTSRGCPYHCNFCSVTRMFGHKYRTHSVDRIIEEIRSLRNRTVFIYDDNFTASPARTFKILDRMLSEGIRLKWSAQVRCETARRQDLVKLMARAGCTRVYVGFESICDESLNGLNKQQTKADVINAVETFHRHGISVHGMFILGTDNDPPGLAEETVRFCKRYRIDSVQFLLLTPFPGTPLFSQMVSENRLLHRRWSYYDAMHTVIQPKTGTAADVQSQMMQAFDDFYSLAGALNDGLNAIFEGIRKAPAVITRGARILNLVNAATKLGARHIINQWLKANREYIAWVQRTSS
jgi:radical SAM superfamily enzyme YgiQ (UPF0313 family)